MNAQEYLDQTESALRHLFTAIEMYRKPFQDIPPPGISLPDWIHEDAQRIALIVKAHSAFNAEVFALSMLCGSVLQIAHKGLESFSKNDDVPPFWASHLGPGFVKRHSRYSVGEPVNKTPMGLIIYAGRNQHVHFDDPKGLDEWPHKILEYATTNYPGLEGEVHPDFFIRPGHPRSLAADIIRLLDWRSYETYITDMRRMLNLPPLFH